MSALTAVVRPRPVAVPTEAPAAVTALRRVAAGVLTLVLVGSVGVFAFLAVGPHLLGYRTMTMLTGSMAPEIVPGDVILSVPVAVDELAVGDVITYHVPIDDHRVETHRIVEVLDQDGRVAVRTQGDANPNVDPWVATLEGDTAWRVSGVVPGLGTAVRTLREPWVEHGVRWLALGGLIGVGLMTIWSRDGSGNRPRGGTRRAA